MLSLIFTESFCIWYASIMTAVMVGGIIATEYSNKRPNKEWDYV